MLIIHHLHKAFGLHPILNDITFAVNNGDRVGLIGPNGCGKSTLLRVIAGQEKADSGAIQFSPASIRLGYLPQGSEFTANHTISQLLHETVGDQAHLEEQLAHLATRLAEKPDDVQVQQAYDETLQRLLRADPGRIQQILATFGLENIDTEMPISTLSGGQKTRLALALLLLDEPDLLLLDEPTNHLDIEMLEWLEEWLNTFNGSVLMVSHDRIFLNRTVNRILDLNPETQTIKEYSGNYTDYLEQFLQERKKQEQLYKDQVYEIRRMKQDIARTREQAMSVERSTTPRQPNVRRIAKKVMKKAKSREKKLERYLESPERVEKPSRSWQMKLDLSDTSHLGKDVIFLEQLAVGYEGYQPLLTAVTQQVQYGERLIITGPNGAGKTSLLRTIAGNLPPAAGEVRLGSSVHLGYMSQEQELLDEALTAVQTIQAVAAMNETDTRSFLHFFLFSGDDALRPCADLSFGERARLSLARLVAQGCNVLLLDEPINHLDIPSRTRFEEALAYFPGTILAIIHDRYFIEEFATRIWTIAEGTITEQL